MKRISIILIPVLLCCMQFGFAQTPAVVVEKQDPLKDSIDKYEKASQLAKMLPFAEQWEAKLKKDKNTNGMKNQRIELSSVLIPVARR
jgi:hypothetical protein